MRLAELSDTTGVTVATLKYYQREGLLHPGRPLSRTQADYDASHVERVRLVRALTEVWTGDATPAEAVLGRHLHVIGPSRDAERFWNWLGRSAFAPTREAARLGA